MFWKQRTGRVGAVLTGLLLAQGLFMGVPEAQAETDNADLGLNVKSAFLIEATTGQVLYALNENEPLPPASMAKMMTEYLVLKQIDAGKAGWDDMVMTSKNAADAIGSGQLMAEGETYPLRNVFELLSIYSGNDAAIALAEHISGTEDEFARLMNETAQELGLSEGAQFINATGLERDDMAKEPALQGETLMSAKDASILARTIITEFPEILEFTKLPQKNFPSEPEPMINWNWMVEGNKDTLSLKQFAYEGLDGLKTGNTASAGYCFTGTAERDGMRLISVVMGADSIDARFTETRKLLDYGFNNFELKTIVTAKTELPDLPSIEIRNAKNREVPVLIGDGLVVAGKKGEENAPTINYQLFETSELEAPLKAGDPVGAVTVAYGGTDYEVPLVVADDVEKAGWFQMLFRGIGDFFKNLFAGITGLFG